MAVFKCKMCGGSLTVEENQSTAVCDYCGTAQTLPQLNNDRRINLYDRANHFRRNSEFDKAMGIYEQILNEDPTDAEAYWSRVLCRYGIEYVEDPTTHKRIPTVNRTQFTSIFDDADYQSALQYGDTRQQELYRQEAETINEIQKGILAISQQEEPFDVFLCYKETDAAGRRTPDSVLAQEIYYELVNEGLKVFFSRITLEDKIGAAYEPYIFAALNSAKVMVVIGTKPEYFTAAWVKNEWSRYLSLIKNGAKKVLIPAYRDMDPYDLPDEFSHLQAQDMGKLGFIQDLLRGIRKLMPDKEASGSKEEQATPTAPLLRRAFLFLEDGEWERANECAEQVLNVQPENGEAYVVQLMVELQCRRREELALQEKPFDGRNLYQKAMRFGRGAVREQLEQAHEKVFERYAGAIYQEASLSLTAENPSEEVYRTAARSFASISRYRDAGERAQDCLRRAEAVKKDRLYEAACRIMPNDLREGGQVALEKFLSAEKKFRALGSWRDAEKKAEDCAMQAAAVRKNMIYASAVRAQRQDTEIALENARRLYLSLQGWWDAPRQAQACQKRLEELKTLKAQKEIEERHRQEKMKRRKVYQTWLFVGCFCSLIVCIVLIFLISVGEIDEATFLCGIGMSLVWDVLLLLIIYFILRK
ncbi:TIR domain-containing protein [Neglectibacter timonensis]|uniref:TIR domain-containing protein n=1 Tax=Neglectibacter timonensis TaxID=1776382 RepID=UPI00248F2BCA|nr:TIR domain-containing protein [Neglectibacter timonensis]